MVTLDAPTLNLLLGQGAGAGDEPEEFCRRVGEVLHQELAVLLFQPPDERLEQRHRRYRNLGLT